MTEISQAVKQELASAQLLLEHHLGHALAEVASYAYSDWLVKRKWSPLAGWVSHLRLLMLADLKEEVPELVLLEMQALCIALGYRAVL